MLCRIICEAAYCYGLYQLWNRFKLHSWSPPEFGNYFKLPSLQTQNTIQKIPSSDCSIWLQCLWCGLTRCRYRLWAGYGILIMPALPPGLSSKQCHWSFQIICKGDVENHAWREIFAQGRSELWPCVLVNSSSLYCRVLVTWDSLWRLLASSHSDISSCGYLPPSQEWAGEEAACILLQQENADRTYVPLICTEQMDIGKMNSEIHSEFN